MYGSKLGERTVYEHENKKKRLCCPVMDSLRLLRIQINEQIANQLR